MVADLDIKYTTVTEGKALIRYPFWPKLERKMPIFYNPSKKFDRDVSVLMLKAYQFLQSRELDICDLLSGTGVRGIRYFLELGPEKIGTLIMNDKNEKAGMLIRENLKLNNIESSSVHVYTKDAFAYLSDTDQHFDFIDIDPFGSSIYFIPYALFKLRNKGLLALTATDTAALTGTYPKVTMMRYNSYAKKIDMFPELALRIFIKQVISLGAMYDIALKPVFAYWGRNYVRAYFTKKRSTKSTKELIKQLRYLGYCNSCYYRVSLKIDSEIPSCNNCGNNLKLLGPIYGGNFIDENLIKHALRYSEDTFITSFLNLLLEESKIETPYFYRTDVLSRVTKRQEPRLTDLIQYLNDLGYFSVKTHFFCKGFKTSIPYRELLEIYSSFNRS